jgi:plasmid stability protein
MHEGSVVFRTTQDTFTDEDLRTGIAHAEYHVALEVDQIDLATREGWTVLIRGAAHHLDTEAERASILSTGVEPWIEGEPEHAIRINPTRIWGHRIRLPTGSSPAVSVAMAGIPCWPEFGHSCWPVVGLGAGLEDVAGRGREAGHMRRKRQ